MTCEEVRLALGAHALGALDPREAEEIDLHLATCEECGGELEELAGVAGFLGKVSERDVELVASPPRRVLERLLTDRVRRRRRARALMAVAAAAAVVGVGGVVWSTMPGESPTAASAPVSDHAAQSERQAQPQPEPEAEAGDTARSEAAEDATEPQDAEALSTTGQKPFSEARPKASPTGTPAPLRSSLGRVFTRSAAGHKATVTAAPDGPRTDLMVRVEGVKVGTDCRLEVVARDGSRERTEPWRISRATYEDDAVFRYESSTAMADIAAFEIFGDDALLLRIPVTRK
ncbi:zf-HC2 domain-containing protein [Nonomuraea sp. NPDC048826]|uniref:zf-HC2 domain-containing protein n=1 Tax=Nonomuraea sp. NPDC048826 TaxID=3364347 RepID=UPI00371CD09F